MYIGPWQEYKLSKQRGNDRPRLPPKGGPSSSSSQTPVPQDVMKQLEKALQNSLDPAAAQAAMQAMNQVLRSQMQLGAESDFQSFPSHTVNKTNDHHPTHHSINAQHSIDSLSTHMAQQRHQRGSGHEKSSSNNHNHNGHGQRADSPRRNVMLYPTDPFSTERDRHFVPMMILSARDNYHHQQHHPSPLSVRSSQSEPIQSLPSLIHITPAVSKQVIPQYNSLTSKNLAINQQRLVQQKEYDGGRRDIYPDQAVNSAPKVPEPPAVIAAKSGYDTNALVNFLRMERNQRARSEISKLTGWNVLHGGGGLAADVRTSLASDSSLSDSKPTKDKATVLREKRVAEVEQMKAMYLKGARDIGGLSSGVNSPRVNPLVAAVALESSTQPPVAAPSSSSLVSPIPSPRLVDIDHLSDEHLMLVSKYFQEQYAETYHHGEAAGIAMPKGSTGTDYASLPLEESNLRPSRSMASMQPIAATISVPAVHRSMVFSDEDDNGSSHATSNVASRARLLSTGEDADGSDDEKDDLSGHGEDEDPVPSTYEATNRVQSPSPDDTLILFSPPDTAQGKVHATGSLMEDLHSGNLDSLLSWTRGLDNFDLDNI